MLTFVMDGPLVLERITHFQFGTMMPSGAVHPIIYDEGALHSIPDGTFEPKLPLPGPQPPFVGCVTKAITITG